MSPRPSTGLATLPIQFLQWAVGIVLLIASMHTFFHSSQKLAAQSSPHLWFLPLLSGVEIVGAILFLIPRLSRIGAYLLLVVLGVAILFHVLHGDWEVGALVVYLAAIVVVRSGSGGF